MGKKKKENSLITILVMASASAVVVAVFIVIMLLMPKSKNSTEKETSLATATTAAKETTKSEEKGSSTEATISNETTSAKEVQTVIETIEATDGTDASEQDNTTENTEKAETESEKLRTPEYISILAVGDNLIHKEIDVTVEKADGSYDFSDIYSAVAPHIAAADVAILNQEVPCAGNQYGITGYPCFNCPEEVLNEMAKIGFDVLTLATNHACDMGEIGINHTLDYLHTNFPNILTTGTYQSKEASETTPIIEVKGVKIAVLNYTYDTNGIAQPAEYSVNLLSNEDKIYADIQRAKKDADFVIVCPHWGTEYSRTINENQQRLAQLFADWGADLIIGTHPHVPQPMDTVTAADGRVVPVYYSLGNFVGAQAEIPKALGGMAKVTLYVDEYGKVSVASTDYDFTVTFFTAKDYKFTSFKIFMAREFPQNQIINYGIYLWEPMFTWQSYLDVIYSLNPYWQ